MDRAQIASSEPARRPSAAQRDSTTPATDGSSLTLDGSPRQRAQRRQLHASFGSAVQRAGAEDELLQGRFAPPLQRVEEEEPLQGRFAPVQRAGVEDEEPLQGRFTPPLQRAEEEELLQGRFDATQRVGADDEELLQGRFAGTAQRAPAESAAPNRTGLPDALKSGIEALSGMDLSDVRVHANSGQPAQLNALAYAQGNDIHVAPGQEQHLPHEAWHVVQQRQGRVQPTMQLAGTAVNDDVALETEADVMGAKALASGVQAVQARARADAPVPARVAMQRREVLQAAGVVQRQQTDVCLKSASGTYDDNTGTTQNFSFLEGSKGSDVLTTTKSHPADAVAYTDMAIKYLKKNRTIPRDATNVVVTDIKTYGIKL